MKKKLLLLTLLLAPLAPLVSFGETGFIVGGRTSISESHPKTVTRVNNSDLTGTFSGISLTWNLGYSFDTWRFGGEYSLPYFVTVERELAKVENSGLYVDYLLGNFIFGLGYSINKFSLIVGPEDTANNTAVIFDDNPTASGSVFVGRFGYDAASYKTIKLGLLFEYSFQGYSGSPVQAGLEEITISNSNRLSFTLVRLL